MRRLRLTLLCALVVVPVAGCGDGGASFGCTGHTCKASFQGPGAQDLSSHLGAGATVEVVTVAADSVAARIAGHDATLAMNDAQPVAGYIVTLTRVDGEAVDLRIVGE